MPKLWELRLRLWRKWIQEDSVQKWNDRIYKYRLNISSNQLSKWRIDHFDDLLQDFVSPLLTTLNHRFVGLYIAGIVCWVCWVPVTTYVLITYVNFYNYDDVIKWKHFPRYWQFVRAIHRSPVNSKGQWRGALMFLWSASESTVE